MSSTSISSKREFISTRFTPPPAGNGITYSTYGMFAGLATLIVGAILNISVLLMVGFLAIAFSGVVLNSLFWADYYEKRGQDGNQPSFKNFENGL